MMNLQRVMPSEESDEYKNRMADLKVKKDEAAKKSKKYQKVAYFVTIASVFATFYFIFKWRKINPLHAIWATIIYIAVAWTVFINMAFSGQGEKTIPIVFFPFFQIFSAVSKLGRGKSDLKDGDYTSKS